MRSALGALALVVLGCATPQGPTDASSDAGSSDDAGLSLLDAGPCTPVDFVAALADPLAPARRLPGRAFLVSSRSPEPPAGMHNDDYAHFSGFDEGRAILADETGPGVLTRLWFTYGPPSLGVIDDVPLRLRIDGRDVVLDQPLASLVGDPSSTFPAPWSMDPSQASGGLVIATPIAFQHSAVVELSVADGAWAYDQIDVRRLPAGTCVRSFDGAYTAEDLAALDAAAALWGAHEHPGDDRMEPARTLAPGETIELVASGPGAITTIEVTAPLGTRTSLGLHLDVDGDVAADGPLAWITGSDAPAGTYAAGLTASSTTSAILYAPIPFASSARVAVQNGGTSPVEVGLRARVLAMTSIPSDVGRFRAECGASEVSIPIHAEQPPFADEFPNVVLAHTTHGPGQFAGLTTFQTAPDQWFWALEPDHEVAIDGQYDILGTGTEDYFGGAFYFMGGPYASITSGASGWTRPIDATLPIPDAHTHLYRHHLVDTWPFDAELSFEMESYLDGTRYEGCAFYYVF